MGMDNSMRIGCMAVVMIALLTSSDVSVADEPSASEKAANWTQQVERGMALACFAMGESAEKHGDRGIDSSDILYMEKLLGLIEKHCKRP